MFCDLWYNDAIQKVSQVPVIQYWRQIVMWWRKKYPAGQNIEKHDKVTQNFDFFSYIVEVPTRNVDIYLSH